MAKITDPDSIAQTTDIVFNTGTLRIEVKSTGAIDSSDGITLQCLYSFAKEEWYSDTALNPYKFPLIAITPEKFELVEGWDFLNDSSRNLIRDAGWAVIEPSTEYASQKWYGITTLGSFDNASHTAYYTQVSGGTPVDCNLSGPVNQAIQFYRNDNADTDDDTADANEYNRNSHFHIYLRDRNGTGIGSTFDDYDLINEQNIAALDYQKYSMPLFSGPDIKLVDSILDTDMSSAPYTGMSITWYTSAQQRLIDGSNRDFHVIIDGNNGTKEQIYAWVQYQLRQSSDIDDGAGTVRGDTSEELIEYIGSTVKTKLVTEGGVYIDNYQSAQENDYVFVDDLGIERTHTVLVTFSFTISPSITGYEWRLYEDSGQPGELGTNELDGEETATQDNQSYQYSYTSDTNYVLQVLADGYEEYITYGTLSSSNQNITVNLTIDNNI